MVALGAGEILLTSMDRDGTRNGFDLALTRAVADAVPVPVIASGGVGSSTTWPMASTHGGADAVLAASIFHFGEHTVPRPSAAWRHAASRCATEGPSRAGRAVCSTDRPASQRSGTAWGARSMLRCLEPWPPARPPPATSTRHLRSGVHARPGS
jgi:hypothetical protein